MPNAAAIAGAIFFLAMFVASVTCAVVATVDHVWPGTAAGAASALGLAYAIVSSDWPRVWKPLITGGRQ